MARGYTCVVDGKETKTVKLLYLFSLPIEFFNNIMGEVGDGDLDYNVFEEE